MISHPCLESRFIELYDEGAPRLPLLFSFVSVSFHLRSPSFDQIASPPLTRRPSSPTYPIRAVSLPSVSLFPIHPLAFAPFHTSLRSSALPVPFVGTSSSSRPRDIGDTARDALLDTLCPKQVVTMARECRAE